MSRTIQIRDVDDATYTVLRTRAAAAHLSLTAYLRNELDRMASGPTMADLIERADRRGQRGIKPGVDVAALIREARDERDR